MLEIVLTTLKMLNHAVHCSLLSLVALLQIVISLIAMAGEQDCFKRPISHKPFLYIFSFHDKSPFMTNPYLQIDHILKNQPLSGLYKILFKTVSNINQDDFWRTVVCYMSKKFRSCALWVVRRISRSHNIQLNYLP